jgi:hypothetical protein
MGLRQHIHNPIHKRFVGNGNTWVGDGRYRGWQIRCAECGKAKVITSHNSGGQMPPKILMKKFEQAGLLVGEQPEDDLCVKCYNNRRAEQKREKEKEKQKCNVDATETAMTEPKNDLHELALLAKLAITDGDQSMAQEAVQKLIDHCANEPQPNPSPPMTAERAAQKIDELFRKYSIELSPSGAAAFIVKAFGTEGARDIFMELNSLVPVPEESIEATKPPESNIDIQHGSHIDSLPKQPPLPKNLKPVAPVKAKQDTQKASEEDYKKWLAEEQLTFEQKCRANRY